MLANVKWSNEVSEDALGTTFFVGDGSTQFIDVTAICRCVGFSTANIQFLFVCCIVNVQFSWFHFLAPFLHAFCMG